MACLKAQPSVLVTILLVMCCVAHAFASSNAGETQVQNAQQKRSGDLDVYWFPTTADRFATFVTENKDAVETFHTGEQDRLEKAIRAAETNHDKSLLELTAIVNEEDRLEAQNAFNEMTNFISTLKQSMGALGSVASCQDLTCGNHALCQWSASAGAQCRCEEGYEGNGFVCNPPSEFSETLLTTRIQPGVLSSIQSTPLQVTDINVASLPGNHVAVVYRDVSQANKGYLMIGKTTRTDVQWTAPVLFSGQSAAYSPVVTELDVPGEFAISYRDDDRGGSGLLVGARFDQTTDEVKLGTAKAYSRHQAQQTAMVSLPGGKVAVMYAEHVLSGQGKKLLGGAMYGAAVLAQVSGNDAPDIVGKHRFYLGPVARLSAALLTPTTFAVGYRAGDGGQGNPKAEATVSLASLHGSELSFHPNQISLEPDQGQIWARSVALISDSTFSYTYHSGVEQATKQAIIRVNPDSHHLELVQRPQVIARGFTPFVQTFSSSIVMKDGGVARVMPQRGARLVSYFNKDGNTQTSVQLCDADANHLLSKCKDVMTSHLQLTSIGGAPVGDGRIITVFADSTGAPHYHLIGLLDPDQV